AIQGASLTVGTTGPSGTTGILDLNTNNSNFTTSIQSAVQANAVALNIPVDSNPSDDICLKSLNNCAANGGVSSLGGTAGVIAEFTGSNSIGNSGLSESVSTLTYAGNAIVNAGNGFSGNLLDLKLNGTSKLSVNQAGNLTTAGTINGQTISSSANFTGTVAIQGASLTV